MKFNNTNKLLQIGWSFVRISPLSFGGGYAILPAIHREVVESRKWLGEEEMAELLTISGAAPGGVGVNISALTGYRLAGLRGALAAVIGITLPTFLIVLGLSIAYVWLSHFPKMQASMEGIQAAIIGFIAAAAYKMAKASIIDFITFATCVMTVLAMIFLPISPAVLIGLGVIIGGCTVWFRQRVRKSFIRIEEEGNPPQKQNPNDKPSSPDSFMADGI